MKKLFITILTTFLVFFGSSTSISAKVINADKENYTLNADEIINDDLFINTNSANILGTINGNLFISGSSVNVEGTINGDLFVITGEAKISGVIKQNVYVTAGNVTINKAKIENSLFVASGTVNVDKETKIKGSLLSASGTFNNNASIGRNLYVASGTTSIDSTVGKDLAVATGGLTLSKDSKVDGDFYYSVDEEESSFTLTDGIVLGSVNKVEMPKNEVARDNNEKGVANNGLAVFSYISSLIIGFVVIKLFSKKIKALSDYALNTFTSSLGTGFIIMVATIPAAILIMLTIVGIHLGFIIITFFTLATFFAKLLVSLTAGAWLFKRMNFKLENQYLLFATGLLVFYLLKMIPIVGFVASIIFTSVGLGVFYKFYTSKK